LVFWEFVRGTLFSEMRLGNGKTFKNKIGLLAVISVFLHFLICFYDAVLVVFLLVLQSLL
jgi:hypothetical protein